MKKYVVLLLIICGVLLSGCAASGANEGGLDAAGGLVLPELRSVSFGSFTTEHYTDEYSFSVVADIDESMHHVRAVIPEQSSTPVQATIPEGATLMVNEVPMTELQMDFDFSTGSSLTFTVRGSESSQNYTVEVVQMSDPYNQEGSEYIPIFSEENFEYLRNNRSASYMLVNDITLSDAFIPIGPDYSGTFDGGGKTISGLEIQQETKEYVGFFKEVARSGIVRNLNLELKDKGSDPSIVGDRYVGALAGRNLGSIREVAVEGGLVLGMNHVGGLVGVNEGRDGYYGIISQSYSTGDVRGVFATPDNGLDDSYDVGDDVGGLVGANLNASIEASYATGTVLGNDRVGGLVGYFFRNTWDVNLSITKSYATGAASGRSKIGGLVGETASGNFVGATVSDNLENSYATGAATGENNTGGLVGYNNGLITKSYASGRISINESNISNAGGLVGYNTGNFDITNSYFDAILTAQGNGVGGTQGTNDSVNAYYTVGGVVMNDNTETAERITVSSFLNWDFNIWQMDDGDWPTLQ